MSHLLTCAFPGTRNRHTDAVAVDSFGASLNDENLELAVRDKMPKTMDEAFGAALIL